MSLCKSALRTVTSLVLHLRSQLVLQAIDVNEDSVQFFLISFQLIEATLTFLRPLIIMPCNTTKLFLCGMNGIESFLALDVRVQEGQEGVSGSPMRFQRNTPANYRQGIVEHLNLLFSSAHR